MARACEGGGVGEVAGRWVGGVTNGARWRGIGGGWKWKRRVRG